MVVEFLEQCYKSEWLLFRDSGEKTAGRYYFSSPDSLALPGFHNFGAAVWHDKNWTIEQGLGEDVDGPRQRTDGSIAVRRPEPRFVGSSDCFVNGDPISDKADPATLINGYPEQCYVPVRHPPISQPPPMPENLDYERLSAYDLCQVARFWARIIAWMYLNDGQEIIDAVAAFVQFPVTTTFHAEAGNFPAVTTVVHDNYAIVALDGTRNFQQLALQGFQSITGPVNVGAYSTLPLWQQAAAYVHQVLQNDGVADQRPVFLVGHSYGGAVALILAAMYRWWANLRPIKYLTFGSPKIGDERLTGLIERCGGASLTNDNDLVTILPPDVPTMAAVAPLFPLTSFTPWYAWERAPAIWSQDIDGVLSAGSSLALDFGTMFRFTTNAVLGTPQDSIIGHSIGEYERRLELRCPDAGWPVSEEVIEIIETDEDTGGGLVFAGMPGTWRGGGTLLLGGGDVPLTPNGGLLLGGGDVPLTPNGGLKFGG